MSAPDEVPYVFHSEIRRVGPQSNGAGGQSKRVHGLGVTNAVRTLPWVHPVYATKEAFVQAMQKRAAMGEGVWNEVIEQEMTYQMELIGEVVILTQAVYDKPSAVNPGWTGWAYEDPTDPHGMKIKVTIWKEDIAQLGSYEDNKWAYQNDYHDFSDGENLYIPIRLGMDDKFRYRIVERVSEELEV